MLTPRWHSARAPVQERESVSKTDQAATMLAGPMDQPRTSRATLDYPKETLGTQGMKRGARSV